MSDDRLRLALPYSFPIVDAGVARWLAGIQEMDGPDEPSLTARRQQPTTGSCYYHLALMLHKEHVDVAIIAIQAVGETLTKFEIQATEKGQRNDGITELMTGLIDAVQRYFKGQDIDMQDLAKITQERGESIPPMPPRDADAETHARWQAKYGPQAGYSDIAKYANDIMQKSPRRLYNVRKDLGLTTPRQGKPKRGKRR